MEFLYLKSTKKGKTNYGTIYARIRKGNINRKYSLGYCISDVEWESYRCHKYQSKTLLTSIGITFDQFVQILGKIKHYFDTQFNADDAKQRIREIKTEVLYGTRENVQKRKSYGYYLDDCILKHYEDLLSGKRLKTGTTVKVKEGTAIQFRTLHRKILKYQRYKYHRYTLDEMNMEFQRDFVSWLKKKGHNQNGVHSILVNIWTVLRCAYEDHLTENDITRFAEFVPRAKETDDIYITNEQIDELYNLDLSSVDKVKELITQRVKNEKKRNKYFSQINEQRVELLSTCRDIFVIGCLTGQRVSDYSRISKKMVTRLNDEWFIRLIQKKTQKKVYIPLSKKVLTILERHDGQLPEVCLSTLNHNLGRLFAYIGWDWKAKIDKSRMGRRRGERFCDMVSSHTARRSFATNAYTYGINIASIMAVTGHSTEKVFRRYLKLITEDSALLAAEDLKDVMEL